jgi:hypothetical protein
LDPDPYWIRIRIGIQPKILKLDPDPDEMNADPQPWPWVGHQSLCFKFLANFMLNIQTFSCSLKVQSLACAQFNQSSDKLFSKKCGNHTFYVYRIFWGLPNGFWRTDCAALFRGILCKIKTLKKPIGRRI